MLVGWSVGRLVCWSLVRFVNRLVSRLVGVSFSLFEGRVVCLSVGLSLGGSASRFVCQSFCDRKFYINYHNRYLGTIVSTLINSLT